MNGPIPSSWSPVLLSCLRIVAALNYMMHGTQKLIGLPDSDSQSMTLIAGADLMTRMGAAGLIETFGGLLLLLGLFTRPVAFLCAGQMAAAYFLVHFPRGFLPILNGGELAAVFCFTFLFIAAAGPGPVSLDGTRRR